MKRERRGDWPIELDVLDEAEAKKLTHDQPPEPTRGDELIYASQVEFERKHPHPATRHRPDDKDLD